MTGPGTGSGRRAGCLNSRPFKLQMSAKLAKTGRGGPHADAHGEGRQIRLRSAHRFGARGAGCVAKHGRAVVVVMAIEEYERLKAVERKAKPPNGLRPAAKRTAAK